MLMNPTEGVSDNDIKEWVAYMRTLKKTPASEQIDSRKP
jgi:hypothetical protein